MEGLTNLLTVENLKVAALLVLSVTAAWGWVSKILADWRAKDYKSLAKHFVLLAEGVQDGTIAPDESKAYMAVKTANSKTGVLLNGVLAEAGLLGKSKENVDAEGKAG